MPPWPVSPEIPTRVFVISLQMIQFSSGREEQLLVSRLSDLAPSSGHSRALTDLNTLIE